MFSWIINNIGTVLAVLALIVVVALIITKMIRDKKTGCGCGCENCSIKCDCNKK